MISGVEVLNLKRIVDKNPKSLLFAYLADSLRESSLGTGEKLNEALEVANRGLDANPDFLQGLLVRGRILFEKGDLSGAKIDFETVAARDQFCLFAQKSLLEISKKLGQTPETEIYVNILNALGAEPSAGNAKELDLVPFERPAKKTEAVAASLSAVLDDILIEEDDDETKLVTMISQAVDKVILKNVAKTPVASPAPKQEPKPESKPLPSLSLPEVSTGSIFEKSSPEPAPKPAPQSLPNLDDLINEQLSSKVEDAPDLTKDMASLLADAIATAPEPEPEPEPELAVVAPNLDDLINEQLSSKVEDVPDLTKDMASLLADAIAVAPEPEPELTSHISSSAPNLDDLVKEQLASKVEDIPDLTKDMASLLDFASESEEPDIVQHISTALAPAPNLDDLVNEQLASKVEDIPDLTKDMASLLADAVSESEVEPDLVPYIPSTQSMPSAAATPAPNLDDLVKEQLASKMEDIPDLTKDMASLLADAIAEPELEPEIAPYIPASPAPAPNLDDLVNEQLASKVEDIPDLTKDMASLLADVANESETSTEEPELIPYVPPSKRNTEATEAIKHPTLTLAELYMDQGLPNKAIEVYKELLVLEPNNEDIKTKLAIAEVQAKT